MNRILLLPVCLAAAAGAFFLALDPGPEVVLVETGAGAADGGSSGGRSGVALQGAAVHRSERADEDPFAIPETGRVAVDGDQGEPVRPLVVQVWFGREGVPGSGAEVFFAEAGGNGARGARARAWFGRARDGEHWSGFALREGERYVADDAGRVTLPPVENLAIVTARRPGEYGFVTVRRPHRPVETIVLERDETLRIEVVDGRGRGVPAVPVGVHQHIPVRRRNAENRNRQALRALEEELRRGIAAISVNLRVQIARRRAALAQALEQAPATALATRLDLRTRRETDAAGRAVVEHVQLHRRKPESWWPAEHRDRLQVALLVPALQPVAVPIDGVPAPAATIRLTMPPTGSVVVRVVDHQGRPFAHAANAELRVQGDGVPKWTRIDRRQEPGADGITFPFVGLGLQVRPHVWLDDRSFTWDGATVPGPAAAGERVAIEVPVPPRFGMLRGRIVDGEGRPLAGAQAGRITFLIDARAGRLEREKLVPDAAGRFQLMFRVGERHRPPFTLEARDPRTQPPKGVVSTLPQLADGRTVDIGDLCLEPYGAFVRGTVRDDRRQPVAGARVHLQRERDVGRQEPKLAWRDTSLITARTDESGSFALYADPPPGRYRVAARSRDHFDVVSDRVTRGGRVALTMTRTAQLAGVLGVPPWLPARSLQVRLASATDARLRRDAKVRQARGATSFSFGSVQPGIYDVAVCVVGWREPVLRVDGVQVEAGLRGTHPRLADLDLTATLYRFQIRAVDGAGQPLQSLSGPLLARVVQADGTTGFVGFPWNGGRIEIFGPSPQMEVVQMSTGYRVQRTWVSHGTSQLQFLALPPVQLRMPGIRALVGPDLRVRVSTVLTGDTGFPTALRVQDQRSGRRRSYSRAQLAKSSGAWLGAGDTVEVPLMHGGRYQVVLRLREQGVPEVPVVLGRVDVVFATDGSPPRVQLAVDAKKVRAGLDRVARHVLARAQKEERQRGRKGGR